ncbi:MAG: phosphoserine phosphatase SerB [Nitrospira sp.]|nr:phosphoserine phosphatase SerB [Candidatus Manganitrophaceae bacterium]HIL34236.1 phosphoserine phosphatase SerB [Candidatus Manganitrophaceae bacterium]
MPKKNAIHLSLSGPDKPGITAAFTQILSESGVRLLDIEQVVTHSILFLSILVESSGFSEKSVGHPAQEGEPISPTLKKDSSHLLRDLLLKAHEMDLTLQFKVVRAEEVVKRRPLQNYIVTCLGPQISLPVITKLTEILSMEKINIQKINTIARKQLECIEMSVSARKAINSRSLRKKLLHLNAEFGIDIAVQDETSFRRAKRLVVMDMDSTLIQVEIIDELAKEAGVGKQVAAITYRAMNGEISFQKSLRERMRLLKGLPVKVLNKVYRRMPYTLGAKALISFLKRSGYRTAVISGGFDYFTSRVKEALQLDYAYSNQLGIKNGLLTGKIIGEIVDGKKKETLMEEIAEKEGITLDQVVAIGDGSNDLPMIARAGLGIAFNAKPRVREAAHFSITQKRLDSILYLLGITDQDLKA